MLDMDVTVDEKSQSLASPIKHNHSSSTPSTNQIFYRAIFVPDKIKCQRYTTTHTPGQKLPPSGKEYICFQTDGINYRVAKCVRSQH